MAMGLRCKMKRAANWATLLFRQLLLNVGVHSLSEGALKSDHGIELNFKAGCIFG
jgi:hypothetical protein